MRLLSRRDKADVNGSGMTSSTGGSSANHHHQSHGHGHNLNHNPLTSAAISSKSERGGSKNRASLARMFQDMTLHSHSHHGGNFLNRHKNKSIRNLFGAQGEEQGAAVINGAMEHPRQTALPPQAHADDDHDDGSEEHVFDATLPNTAPIGKASRRPSRSREAALEHANNISSRKPRRGSSGKEGRARRPSSRVAQDVRAENGVDDIAVIQKRRGSRRASYNGGGSPTLREDRLVEGQDDVDDDDDEDEDDQEEPGDEHGDDVGRGNGMLPLPVLDAQEEDRLRKRQEERRKSRRADSKRRSSLTSTDTKNKSKRSSGRPRSGSLAARDREAELDRDLDPLGLSRHGFDKERKRASSSRRGSSTTADGDNTDDIRKSRHGSATVEDLLKKSRYGRHSEDQGGNAMRKSRHGNGLSRSRHGSHSASTAKEMMRKSRHGGTIRSGEADKLAPSKHGARLSTELESELQQNGGGGKANGSPSNTKLPTISTCCVCNQPARTYLQALNKKYHHSCFNCVGCNEPIDPSAPFTYMSEGGEKHPLHMACHAELYGMKCTVCLDPIPAGPDGKIKYTKHPFFSNEVMCPTHVVESDQRLYSSSNASTMSSRKNRPVRRCTSCHRFEPYRGKGFLDLGDHDRCVCMACCRTIVCDSVDAQPLWRKVLKFWERTLQLPVWEGMREVPILVVGSDVMSEQVLFGESSGHTHHHHGMTRGLCLSEQQATYLPASVTEDGKPLDQAMNGDGKGDPKKSSELTAILCLTGLPSDLTASVLAHEAMHAWFKLHPEFGSHDKPIPAHVEEGCAQLMAYLYLTEREEAEATKRKSSSNKDDSADGPSDEKLRQYFKYSIESDASEIYGHGFRKASKAYEEVGVEMLLNHVAYYRNFPEL